MFPVAAQASGGIQLDGVAAKQSPDALVTFTGRAGTRAGSQVTVQREVGRRWRRIAGGRTGARGRFALTWITPSRASRVLVRATLGRRASATRRFRVLAPPKGAAMVVVSPKTQVISPSVVQSVPAAGTSGTITYAGGNQAQVGQILAIGQGPATPDGFLARVTNVTQANGQTVATTVPATLMQAVPQGSLDLVASDVTGTEATAGTASRRATISKATISCEGSAGVTLTHDVTFGAGLHLAADWTLLHGLRSASLTADASLNASLQAAVAASGTCSLAKRVLLTLKGPSIDTFVGPVPVVMTSKLTVYLDASASASASVTTGVSAGFSASAGVGWTKGDGFHGIDSFSPHFSYQPPSLSANASIQANVTPTVDVLLYGVVGPEIALKTGVDFEADITQNPWWTLAIPVDLTASIAIPPLGLTSPEFHVYDHSFPLADAGGPFGTAPPAPGAPPTPPTPVHNVATPASSLGAGYDQSCALRSSGAVACWGGNTHGQLGNASNSPSSTPVAVKGITDAAAIAAGNDHSCALRVAGGVLCWGADGSGELGNGSSGGDSSSPVAVNGISNAVAIAAGATDSCAVLQTGHVDCWGADDQNQLGDGDGSNTASSSPIEVSGITHATAIASGTFHACALLKNGTVSCWGNNSDGSLGNGTPNPTSVPVNVSGVTNATAVAAGADHSCALLSNGTVWCWGQNGDGQLGNGTYDPSNVPVQVRGITNATTIAAGGGHTCARLSTGSVVCWGWNNYGQLGNGSMPANSDVPVTVSGISNSTAVTGGLEHTCELNTSGGLACWGYGGDGELGNGQNSTQPTPVKVTGLP